MSNILETASTCELVEALLDNADAMCGFDFLTKEQVARIKAYCDDYTPVHEEDRS